MENKKYETRKSTKSTTKQTSSTAISSTTTTTNTTDSENNQIKSIQIPIYGMRNSESDNNNKILSRTLLQHEEKRDLIIISDNNNSSNVSGVGSSNNNNNNNSNIQRTSCSSISSNNKIKDINNDKKSNYNANIFVFDNENKNYNNNNNQNKTNKINKDYTDNYEFRTTFIQKDKNSMSPTMSSSSPPPPSPSPHTLLPFFLTSSTTTTATTIQNPIPTTSKYYENPTIKRTNSKEITSTTSILPLSNFTLSTLFLKNLNYNFNSFYNNSSTNIRTAIPTTTAAAAAASTSTSTSHHSYTTTYPSTSSIISGRSSTDIISIPTSSAATTTLHQYQKNKNQIYHHQQHAQHQQQQQQFHHQHHHHQHHIETLPTQLQYNKSLKDYHVVVVENRHSDTNINENLEKIYNIEQQKNRNNNNKDNKENGKTKYQDKENDNNKDKNNGNNNRKNEIENRNGKENQEKLYTNESKSLKEKYDDKKTVIDYKYANVENVVDNDDEDDDDSITIVKDDDERIDIERKFSKNDDIELIQQQLYYENLQQQQQQQQQQPFQHQTTRCCCNLTHQLQSGEQSKSHYYQHQYREEQQQQQQQQQEQQQLLQHRNYYTHQHYKDIKKDINVKENPKRDLSENETEKFVSKDSNGQENLDKNASNKKQKKLSKDEEKDELFQIFEPWALKTYGDQAKTKTITLKKKTRILKALDGKEHSKPDSSKFRFWVKSKGFTTRKPENFVDTQEQYTQSKRVGITDNIDLYVASTSKDFGERFYRKVAVVEEFFDIIYDVHVHLGGRSGRHAGQKRTYRIITETYAFLPREAVTKFLTACPECKKNLRPYSPNTKVEDQQNDVSVESTEALNYSSHTESSKDSANLESKKLKTEESEDVVLCHEPTHLIPSQTIIQSKTSHSKSPILQRTETSVPKSFSHQPSVVNPSQEQQFSRISQKSDIRLHTKNPITSTTTSATESLAQKLKARKRSCESQEEFSPKKDSYEPYCKTPKTLEFHPEFYKNQENLFNYFQLLKKFYYRPPQLWQSHHTQDPSPNMNPTNVFPSPTLSNFQPSDISNFFNSMQQMSNAENILKLNPLNFSPSSMLFSGTSHSDQYSSTATATDNQSNNQKSPNQSSHSTSDLRTSPSQQSQNDRNNSKKISPTSYSKQININIENAINLSTDSIDLTITPPNHHHHHHHHHLGQTGSNTNDNTNLMMNSLDVSINVSNDSNQLKISCKTTPPSTSPSTSNPSSNAKNQTTTPTSHFHEDKRFRSNEKRTIYKPDSVDISPPFVTSTCSSGQSVSSTLQQSQHQASESMYHSTLEISPSMLADLTSVSNKNDTNTSTTITEKTITLESPISVSYSSYSPPVMMTSDRQTCAINLSKKFHETKRYCDDGTQSGNPSQDNLKDCKIKNIDKSKAHNGNSKIEKDFISYDDIHGYKNENEDVLMMMKKIKNNNKNISSISSRTLSSTSSSSSSSSSAASSVVRVDKTIKPEFSSYYGIDYKDIGMIMSAGNNNNNNNNNNGSSSSNTCSTIIQVPIPTTTTTTPTTTTSASILYHQQQLLPTTSMAIPSASHSYQPCDVISDGSGNFYISKKLLRNEKKYHKKDNNDTDNDADNDDNDNDDDDNDDDNDVDNDRNKNINKIDLTKVKPITSTYLTLTRSMGLSDEDALKFDDLVSKDFKYSI